MDFSTIASLAVSPELAIAKMLQQKAQAENKQKEQFVQDNTNNLITNTSAIPQPSIMNVFGR